VIEAAAELEFGISLGLSPLPEQDETDGVAITKLSSWWNHLHCRTCGHTFRRGDRVRVNMAERTVTHLVPGLACGEPAGDSAADAEVAAFRAGVLAAWPVPEGVRVRQLAADDWRIPAGPADLREANVCLHCGHTFRAGEYVVVCPCRPALPQAADGEPRTASCGRAVHRDPAAGLSCWEQWRPDGVVTVCPVTQVRVD
jgi:hypothetical protein